MVVMTMVEIMVTTHDRGCGHGHDVEHDYSQDGGRDQVVLSSRAPANQMGSV